MTSHDVKGALWGIGPVSNNNSTLLQLLHMTKIFAALRSEYRPESQRAGPDLGGGGSHRAGLPGVSTKHK
jgi:hypothetical protein